MKSSVRPGISRHVYFELLFLHHEKSRFQKNYIIPSVISSPDSIFIPELKIEDLSEPSHFIFFKGSL